MILGILLIITLFLNSYKFIFAIDPPVQTRPENNSTVSSSKLTWQQVIDSIQYRVIVDDESSLSTPYIRSYYLTNTSYSPELNPGTYYWKVGAKDSGGMWFWSKIWSFTLQTAITAITSSPTPTPTPSPISSSTTLSSFTISNIPSQIDSNQTFTVPVELVLSNSPNNIFYLKGAFKKSGKTNYFGLTKVQSSWIKNGSSYLNQYKVTTDALGNWSGSLEIKPDTDDTGFEGTGDYIFKMARYTSSGSGPTWSNEATINLIGVAEESIKGETDLQTTPVNNNQPKKSSEVKGLIKTNIKKVPFNSSPSSQVKQSTPQAEQSTYSAQVKNSKQTYPLIILGTVLTTIGLGSIIYILWRQQKLKS